MAQIVKPKVGRPTKITPEVLEAILTCFRNGMYNREMCQSVGISEEIYYDHMKNDLDFAAKVDLAKESVTETARSVVAKKIIRGDVESAKWWLERKNRKEFSTRSEITGADGESLKIQIVEDTDLKEANEDKTED